MNPLPPKSPLLISIENKIRLEGGNVVYATRNDDEEWISTPLFLEIPNGLIQQYTDQFLQGEPTGPKDDDHVLEVYVSSSGTLKIVCGQDPDETYLLTSIQSEWEFNEVLDFFANAKIKKDTHILRSLVDLIDEVYLYIPNEMDSEGFTPECLWKIQGQTLKKDQAHLFSVVDGYLKDEIFDSINALHLTGKSLVKEHAGYDSWHFGEYLSQEGLKDVFLDLREILKTDIIINGKNRIVRGSKLLENDDSGFGFEPALVLRPNPKISKMWLWDFLNFSTEGEEVVQRLLKGWQYLPKGLCKISISMPRTKTAQTADAIIRREARTQYLDKMQSAMRIREPFQDLTRLYRNRKKAADSLYNQFLEEILAAQNPLPFFIEYPYHSYINTDDRIDKRVCGQRLLEIFTKIPLFLIIEELTASNSPIGAKYLEQIKSDKALSEGAHLNLQKELSKDLVANQVQLRVFRKLANNMMENFDAIGEMVEARNRMQHAPYDEEGFLEAISKKAPKLISFYRDAFEGLNFVIPINSKIVGKEFVLKGEDIKGKDILFRHREYVIKGEMRTFETGKIIAFHNDGIDALKLSFLLNAEQTTKQCSDLVIFNRMKPSGPVYTRIRGS